MIETQRQQQQMEQQEIEAVEKIEETKANIGETIEQRQKRLKNKAGFFLQLYFTFVFPLNVIFMGPTIAFKSSS